MTKEPADYQEFNNHNERIGNARRPLADYYDYLLEDDENKQFELPITHLVHFTTNDFARSIGLNDPNFFCFKPKNWDGAKNNNFEYLSWWSPNPPENWGDHIKNHENYKNYKFGDKDYFCTSPALNGAIRYGPIGIVVSWKNILNQYAASRQKSCADIRLKCFGTFKWQREIMFTILVCIKDDNIKYKDDQNIEHEFDLIVEETKAFRRTDMDENIWKFYSTTCGWNSNLRTNNPACDSWDHLSFAFYFPEEDNILKIPSNNCQIRTKPAIKMTADNELVKQLESKIEKGKDVEKLEKGMAQVGLNN